MQSPASNQADPVTSDSGREPELSSVTVLIPALNPSEALIGLVEALAGSAQVSRIIVVDDGSASECRPVFRDVSGLAKVDVLRHALNLGKGVALKTGMNHFLCQDEQGGVLVTADADGQHLPEDILAVAAKARASPGGLVLGSRSFAGDVPLRCRFGNDLTRWVFRFLIGEKVSDTQTGLRAVPRGLMPRLLRSKARGYEFEMEMLILAARERVPISIVPIRTVYFDGNRESHFNPVLDSMRIYFVFGRFLSSSLLTAHGDY